MKGDGNAKTEENSTDTAAAPEPVAATTEEEKTSTPPEDSAEETPPPTTENAAGKDTDNSNNNSSSEERIRGGGKVSNDRGGRNARRHQPYNNNNNNSNNNERMQDGDRSCRVYVGNLSWNVSWQDLKDHMKSTGLEVARANIMTTPDGRSKGCGIVEFTNPEGAQQAVNTLNDTELQGRNIFVREDREDRNGPGPSGNSRGGGGGSTGSGQHRFTPGAQSQSRRVYVGNLSWDVRWQDLKDHMRQAGEVLHAEVICENNGRSKGCGIVEFSTAPEAQEAIAKLTDSQLKGRLIFVREDRETSSGGASGFQGHRSDNSSVYVWNLSYETSWQDLKDHMRKAGNVDQATILSDSQGNSIGCAVVVYQRPQEAARAIRELQNSELHGRDIYLREDRNHGAVGGGRHHGGDRGGHGHHHHHGGRGGHRGGGRGHGGGGRGHGDDDKGNNHGHGGGFLLFVNNLSYETSWQDLKDHFRQCGDVERAEVMTNAEGRSKGFGTVRFMKEKEAEAAIERLNGQELQGRTLEVRYDNKQR
ncbi:Uncharacterized RNA-binding protein C328.05 [Seminavis robusta]|uniref:Uncharacterized RNA-binding protein C328.05 n=1 Tax=Seminavis robusta TaxID=568900 RepID=A0A9N8DV29_9STRA|nr:Uncharacterized RNA-binding protein C328.05 [Seminavis robusta]|eukprot:Sro382_g130960.1 Uncharacterized RNA-binding protein C328.05 (532) ;mRNA; r:8610-10205